MKDIVIYKAPKYLTSPYSRVAEDIYSYGDVFVTSLSFIQEPELGEGANAEDISQYPLEDVLDRYSVYVSDFYEDLNTTRSEKCYLEFAGYDERDISELLQLVGHRVYNKAIVKNGEEFEELIIE